MSSCAGKKFDQLSAHGADYTRSSQTLAKSSFPVIHKLLMERVQAHHIRESLFFSLAQGFRDWALLCIRTYRCKVFSENAQTIVRITVGFYPQILPNIIPVHPYSDQGHHTCIRQSCAPCILQPCTHASKVQLILQASVLTRIEALNPEWDTRQSDMVLSGFQVKPMTEMASGSCLPEVVSCKCSLL